MKRIYHLCYSSHDEVLFREAEDHDYFFNFAALSAYRTNTEILAEAEMSTHVHLAVLTEVPTKFVGQLRTSYTKYFNKKYGRTGRMGEHGSFCLPIEGNLHIQTMISYVLRNPLHHGQVSTAFGYPYTSTNCMFAKELGKAHDVPVIHDTLEKKRYLPRKAVFPSTWKMSSSGFFLRDSVVEIQKAEMYYITPRNFIYQMNRISDERWQQEQLDDHTGEPISLPLIEPWADKALVSEMLTNEKGWKYSKDRKSDMEICQMIDLKLQKECKGTTVYTISDTKKNSLYKYFMRNYRLQEMQLRRCFAMDYHNP